MTMLPDVPVDDWNQHQADQFSTSATNRIDSLGFSTAANARIADLNNLYAPPPQTQEPGGLAAAAPEQAAGSEVQPPVLPAPPPSSPEPPVAAPAFPDASTLTTSRISPPSTYTPPAAASGQPDYVAMALQAASDAGIDPGLFVAQMQQESGLNPYDSQGRVKTSPAGARGIAQFMPGTAAGLGVNPDDPQQALNGAARMMRGLIQANGGDVTRALAAYNAGQGAVDKAGGVPDYAETQSYVDSIMARVARSQAANVPSDTQAVASGPDTSLTAGTGAPPASGRATQDISQFGDPQLTTDEAYSACGPAAAVRFAEAFGRNPTLREAVDLAKQVGWTPQQGMAGLGSEKALMDKMNVPTKLVQGPQWDVFAKEAQTGNPVTISTAGHYFFADGFNPDTGAFHVGRSGLDLKGGSEWMTPAQMQNLMGVVQGGLLADNPSVQAPSTAQQDTNPAAWLGQQKDALGSSIGSTVQGWTSGLGTLKDAILQPSSDAQLAGQSAAQPTPSDSLTDPLGTRNTGIQTTTTPDASVGAPDAISGTSAPTAPQGPLDVVKQKFSDAIDALGGFLTPHGPNGEPLQPMTREQMNTAYQNSGVRFPSNPLEVAGAGLGAPTQGEDVSAQRNAAIASANPLKDVPFVGGATTFAAQAALDPTNLFLAATPAAASAAERATGAVTDVLGSQEAQALLRSRELGGGRPFEIGAGGDVPPTPPSNPFARRPGDENIVSGLTSSMGNPLTLADLKANLSSIESGRAPLATPEWTQSLRDEITRLQPSIASTPVAPTGTPPPPPPPPGGGATYQSVMPAGTFETPKPPSGTGNALDTVRTNLTRAFTDRQVDINLVQQAYAKALGRPLNADEMAAELQRLSADPAAQVKIDEGLKPAIQSVGNDYNALRDFVTLRSNVQVADALGNDARQFSGGLTAADSQQALTAMESQLGPERFAKVQQAADQVSQFSNQLRQRLVDSGVLSQDQADAMQRMYPDWAKTRILDYMADPAGGQGAGTKLGLADRQLRQYSLEGTARAREDPIASTVAYAHQVERMANKNEAFDAMLTLDKASPNPMLREVPQDFTATKNQVTMIGFQDGQKVKYVTDNKALGEAINGAGVMSTPEWTSAWMRVFRSLATSRNPLFLAGNAALDIPTYTFRTAIRDGGPQALPGIMTDLAKGYASAFQGLFQGEYRGATAAYLKGGGGQSGYFTGAEGEAAQTVADLQRSNVFQINGKSDLLRLAKDLVTLHPVEALGERIELGPRVAAYNRALARGANPVQAVIEGRTVTVDFSQGGTVTKYLNNFIPFFNVGAQGPVQLARAWSDNPRAFVATVGSLIGLPAVAAEVWNRADPQRAQDYADVPEYVKNQGIVVMLPGDAPVDAQGNRKPLYALMKLREWSPFASIARDVTARALGDPKSLADMVMSAGAGVSPTNATSVGQLGTEALSGIPVLPAAAQLEFNKDFFRNRDIVTNRNDQNSSALAKSLTPVLQSALDTAGYSGIEVHPAAVDFFIRNQGAGVGAAVSGASDLAAGTARQDTSPTSLPGVGGLVGRFVSNQTGQGLQTSRSEGLTNSARQILRQNGITTTPGPATSAVNSIPLKLDEETRYQQLLNQYVDDAIHRAVAEPTWASMTQEGKNKLMQRAIDSARQRAGFATLSSIPEAERLRRLQTKSTAPSAPALAGANR